MRFRPPVAVGTDVTAAGVGMLDVGDETTGIEGVKTGLALEVCASPPDVGVEVVAGVAVKCGARLQAAMAANRQKTAATRHEKRLIFLISCNLPDPCNILI